MKVPPFMPSDQAGPPILRHKAYASASDFTPENLLREARRQKGVAEARTPAICILDPDGDIVRRLEREGRAGLDAAWACYHTELYRFSEAGREYGIIGCAVGASYAVLLAEELFASGCELLVSVTSAGQLAPIRPPPYFLLIDRAWRDGFRVDQIIRFEMEAAALYAFATARRKPVLCFAHVTNQMARVEGDFEKGEAAGALDALAVIRAAADAWVRHATR